MVGKMAKEEETEGATKVRRISPISNKECHRSQPATEYLADVGRQFHPKVIYSSFDSKAKSPIVFTTIGSTPTAAASPSDSPSISSSTIASQSSSPAAVELLQ
ncbi:unnamed protein product [Linum trigynum]|uniref:Uncharacterized protein n=1 Tax=Linum trigynum TaxID=586398 RepID=A0AAV2E948_9ROSI